MPALRPGDRLGPYAIVAALGAGGLADVYRGRDTRSGAEVALKVLDAVRRAENPGLRDRLLREAAALESLAGVPGVVGLVERFTDDAREADVLVLELIEGRDLASLVGDRSTPIRSLVEWMGHVCHALHAIHEAGWVHRDLKPENLILVDGADPPIRVIDFNSAGPRADASAGRLTRAQGTFPFTPAYLAPECFDGALPDRSADVYALGLTFAEVLLGAHPLLDPGTSDLATREQWRDAHRLRALPDLASARPDAPPALRRALVRATAKDPAARLPDALALWEALREAWGELDAPAPPPSPRRRRPWAAALAGVGAGLALVAAGIALSAGRPTPEAPEAQGAAAAEEPGPSPEALAANVQEKLSRAAFFASDLDRADSSIALSVDARLGGAFEAVWRDEGGEVRLAGALGRLDARGFTVDGALTCAGEGEAPSTWSGSHRFEDRGPFFKGILRCEGRSYGVVGLDAAWAAAHPDRVVERPITP